ncbi:MAG: hypothetical protein ABSE68_00185 [Minisyncoccia bacterium]
MDTNKRNIIIGVAVVIIAVAFGASLRGLPTTTPNGGQQPGATTLPDEENIPKEPVFYGTPESKAFKADVPVSVTAPTPTISTAPAASNNPKGVEQLRTIDLKATVSGFNPKEIAVYDGDVVRIMFTAVDGDYDISIPYTGNYQFSQKGQTQPIGLGATKVGTYAFMCRDHCPAGKIIEGSFIVLPRP